MLKNEEKVRVLSIKWIKCALYRKKTKKKFGDSEKSSTFATAFREMLLRN